MLPTYKKRNGDPSQSNQTHQAKELKPLTDLRGIAVLWVFVYHLFIKYNIPLTPVTAVGWYGWAGVDLFFVLSGFLLYSKMKHGDYHSKREYFAKRIGKIWPLFYTGILTYYAIGLLYTDPIFLPLYFSFLANYFLPTFTNRPFWTLFLEELFYVLLLIFIRIPRKWIIPLFCFSCVLSILYSSGVPPTDYYLKQFPRYFVDFVAGILIATFRIPPSGLLLLPLSIELINWNILNPYAAVLNALIFSSLIIIALRFQLTTWPTYWLGKISYSFYIWHLMFIIFFDPLTAFLLTITISVVTYFTLEEWLKHHIVRWLT
jgi:peptidoglycan/LPS O-acetylase OafA/YrhL